MNTAKVIQLRPETSQKRHSKSFRKYQALLTGKRALTKNEIMAFCWAMNGVKAIKLDGPDRAILMALFNSVPERPITAEQTEFGLAWLVNHMLKKNGEPRLRCPLSDDQIEILRNFKRFTWAGLFNTQEHFGNYNSFCKSYVPVWRVYDKKGNSFDYAVIGGGPGGSVDVVINPRD